MDPAAHAARPRSAAPYALVAEVRQRHRQCTRDVPGRACNILSIGETNPRVLGASSSLSLSDRAILDAVLTVAYFSFANRLVMGLGLALEPGFEETCRPEITS